MQSKAIGKLEVIDDVKMHHKCDALDKIVRPAYQSVVVCHCQWHNRFDRYKIAHK